MGWELAVSALSVPLHSDFTSPLWPRCRLERLCRHKGRGCFLWPFSISPRWLARGVCMELALHVFSGNVGEMFSWEIWSWGSLGWTLTRDPGASFKHSNVPLVSSGHRDVPCSFSSGRISGKSWPSAVFRVQECGCFSSLGHEHSKLSLSITSLEKFYFFHS